MKEWQNKGLNIEKNDRDNGRIFHFIVPTRVIVSSLLSHLLTLTSLFNASSRIGQGFPDRHLGALY